MRTVTKTLLSLSICLGLSGAVYAQATPETKPAAPATSAATKSKTPGVAKTAKEKPAAISDASKPAVKHEHANHAGKTDKAVSPDAKKIEASKVEAKPEAKKVEHKKVVSKPHEHAAKPTAAAPSTMPVEAPKPVK